MILWTLIPSIFYLKHQLLSPPFPHQGSSLPPQLLHFIAMFDSSCKLVNFCKELAHLYLTIISLPHFSMFSGEQWLSLSMAVSPEHASALTKTGPHTCVGGLRGTGRPPRETMTESWLLYPATSELPSKSHLLEKLQAKQRVSWKLTYLSGMWKHLPN